MNKQTLETLKQYRKNGKRILELEIEDKFNEEHSSLVKTQNRLRHLLLQDVDHLVWMLDRIEYLMDNEYWSGDVDHGRIRVILASGKDMGASPNPISKIVFPQPHITVFPVEPISTATINSKQDTFDDFEDYQIGE